MDTHTIYEHKTDTRNNPRSPVRTGLMTDHYEMTMISSAMRDNLVHTPAVFELFARKLPHGRRFGIVGGIDRFLEDGNLGFDNEEIDFMLKTHAITSEAAEYFSQWKFTGNIYAYREGDVFWPNSPVVRVEAPFGEAVVLETLLLSILNHDSAIASAAARMVLAANGRPIIEMGSRRTHEEAAVSVARTAYIEGFSSTSNLEAGFRYGIPTTGTAAHAFTLAHKDEKEAFRRQIETLGVSTTLLVDTFDTEQGLKNAVEVAREFGAAGPGAVRIDSGVLFEETSRARKILDELGAKDTRITVTSDLDEYLIEELNNSSVDGYGAGTRVATGSGHPTAGMVYKLVAIADDEDGSYRSVAKKASGKGSIGGRKFVFRDRDGKEYFTTDENAVPNSENFMTDVQVKVVHNGVVMPTPSLEDSREFAHNVLKNLPEETKTISDGEAFTSCTEWKN